MSNGCSIFQLVAPFMDTLLNSQVRLLAWQWAQWLSMLEMAAAMPAALRLHHLPWQNLTQVAVSIKPFTVAWYLSPVQQWCRDIFTV